MMFLAEFETGQSTYRSVAATEEEAISRLRNALFGRNKVSTYGDILITRDQLASDCNVTCLKLGDVLWDYRLIDYYKEDNS